MTAQTQPLIRMRDVTRVFLTEEVETHALSGISLDIQRGEYVSIAGAAPVGCCSTTSSSAPAIPGQVASILKFAKEIRQLSYIGKWGFPWRGAGRNITGADLVAISTR